eukprot:CAMPEP_0183558448 /NCGR_PEP_ID=MMETSP0371-20130417/88679_1 /TAXON_ID=268820 /ORGANISM="Peridinium aciculiferum, Strain PAER-2" /LENGTH=221 /DNA_ID=CAMNT_0025765861 /DNA_START=47 /DNA_END=708 /DNA_ORIENTATION=+
MALCKEGLLATLAAWGIEHETLQHALSATCELHSENIKGTAFAKFIGNGQAKNLFFKVPSGGGPLKNRLFLVCALVETVVDNKILSARLGIKPSAPLRFAADDVFTDVLQIPLGSVNPFVMAQASCHEVTLLLDEQFLRCERLLFHPMQSDFTTALAPAQLEAFLQRAAPGRFAFVDLTSSAPLALPSAAGGAGAAGAPAAAPAPAGKESKKGGGGGGVAG